MKKWSLLILVLTLSLLLAACTSSNAENKKVRIGYQKNGTTLTLKSNGDLEKRLTDLGYSVEWAEFNTGSAILEALNSGAIDFANASDTPSVIALSKGLNFKYIATENPSPQFEAILVKDDDSITSLEQLKGKRIAYNKASISEHLLVTTLATVGLTLDDVESVILGPADANIAFQTGEVDAWVTWDPYVTVSENNGNKILVTGENYVSLRNLYYANEQFINGNSEAVVAFVEELQKVGQEIDANPANTAKILQENTGIDSKVWEKSLSKVSLEVFYFDDNAASDLQKLNEELFNIQLTTNLIENIENYIWKP